MKKWITIALTILMVMSPITQTMAKEATVDQLTNTVDIFNVKGTTSGTVRSIDPSNSPKHTYKFYKSESEAMEAQNASGPDDPFDTQIVRTDGILQQQELVEQKDELFEGWYYKEDGKEKPVPFGVQPWIGKNIEFYCYPKRSKVITVFFSHGNTVVKSVLPDKEGFVSIEDQPGVGEPNKVLTGWSTQEGFNTAAEAEAQGKLFYFKEQQSPTKVEGTLILHAIFEDAIRISFDTHGSEGVAGRYIDKGEDVKVPDAIEKVGYTFDHWYVLEEDPDNPAGEKEVKLNTKQVNGVNYFDYHFTKSTTIHAKWKGQETKFSIILMREKLPKLGDPKHQGYEYVGTFNNPNGAGVPKTTGDAGTKVKVYDDVLDVPEGHAVLLKEHFNDAAALGNKISGLPTDYMKGFHINMEESNKFLPVIKGDGTAVKLIYFDRDMIYFQLNEYIKPDGVGDLIATGEDGHEKYDENLKGYKYGTTSSWHPGDGGWGYIEKNYKPEGTAIVLPKGSRNIFSTPPLLVEKVGKVTYLTKVDEKTWVFKPRPMYKISAKDHGLMFSLRIDGLEQTNETEYLQWLNAPNTTKEDIKERLLPIEKPENITDYAGAWNKPNSSFYFGVEDFQEQVGFTPKMGAKTFGTKGKEYYASVPVYKNAHDKLIEIFNELKNENVPKNYGTDPEYYTYPIFYSRDAYKVTFEPNLSGHGQTSILEIPYDVLLVGGKNSDNPSYLTNPQEQALLDYMKKFVKAEFDKKTKELSNPDEVTWNDKSEVFSGWYLDPGFTQPFEPGKMQMPDRNVIVFGKWEPIYHYVKVHHFPIGTSGVNKPENITEIKVAHGKFIDTEEDIIKYPPIPAGRSRTDFQGWESYGDVNTQTPSPSGSGGPFKYGFDSPVNTGFHLYPKWDVNKVRVVYAFNYQDNNARPLSEAIMNDQIMANLDLPNSLIDPNNYFMSEYQYMLDSNVRLRAPLGWDDDGRIIEPSPPQGTAAENKIFLGWKVMYRDKKSPHTWHTTDNLVYYNSEVRFTENAVSHNSAAKKGDAIGALVLVAQWGDKKIDTNITLHRNHSANDDVTKVYNIKNKNAGWIIPEIDATDLTTFTHDGYQFMGWNTAKDGSGKSYKSGETILIDEHHERYKNHLYAQWEKLHEIEAVKKWDPSSSDDYTFKMGLLRRKAPGQTHNPDFSSTAGFEPVAGSLKSYKSDLVDGKMKWTVPGYDENGGRYSYVIVEITPELEDKFNNFGKDDGKGHIITWEDLGVVVYQEIKNKVQTITLPKSTGEIDAFSSATQRENKVNAENKIVGYKFEVHNDKITVPMPIITQPYAQETSVKINPGTKTIIVKKLVVTLPAQNTGEPDVTLTLSKDEDGHFTVSDNLAYKVTSDPMGILTIQLPDGQGLAKDQTITAKAVDVDGFESKTDKKTVLDAQDSFKVEKPVQKKRDSKYNIMIESNIPAGTTVEDGTTFTLTDDLGNVINDKANKPITGKLDSLGKKVIFTVPDGILTDDQQIKIQTEEPTKKPILSDMSEKLDINAPVINATDIMGTVNVALEPQPVVTVTDKNLTNLVFSDDKLPADITRVKDKDTATEITWNITGAGKYIIKADDNYLVTYTAIDQFGNKATKDVQVTISDKELVAAPTIDALAKGDSTAKITPPSNGDTLVVTFPGDKTVTLKKQVDGTWKDEAANESYPVANGKINVKVPGDGKLDVGNIVTAQGKDSTGKLADSAVAIASVKPSTLKTPTPQFDKVTVGDKTFTIKPINSDDANGIVADKLVVTIRDKDGKEVKKIALTKEADGKWNDGTKSYLLDDDGKLTVDIPKEVSDALTAKHSFGATAEDAAHGHQISDPTSINVNAKQSKAPTAKQGQTTPEGNPTITGTGEPGADINVYDKDNNLIAGPVKVDKDGKYEVELPKDKVPADGKVDVKQKEDGKPESEPVEVTIDKTAPEAPVIDQPNVGDTTATIKVPADAEKMIVTLPDGKTIELNKTPEGKWTDGSNEYTPGADGKISVKLLEALKNNDVIKAVALDKFDNKSPEDSKTVGQESFKVEKPVQQPKNEKGETVITSKVPAESNPAEGTIYTLIGKDGNPVQGTDGQPITATPDKDGNLTYNVPAGKVADGDTVTIQVQEPGKEATTSEASDPLDLVGPVITANDITGKVGIEIPETKITTNEAAEITVTPNLPNSFVLGDANTDKTEWIISGKGSFVTETNHKVVAVDKFGNKTEAEFKVTITDKDTVDEPVIDPLSKGDKTAKITPPSNGDTLVVTFLGDKTVTLKKQEDGTWKDEAANESYPVANGKIDVKVPENGKLDVGDIVTAQGKDSTGKLADSAVAKESVKPSNKKTPMPQFDKVTVGDTTFKIEPINQDDIVTDTLVITIQKDGVVEAEIVLTKDADDNWTDQDNKAIAKEGNKLLVSIPDGVTLTTAYSLGATAEDKANGHEISLPASINVNAEQSSSDFIAEQGKTKDNGNPTITGKDGVPGADMSVFDPTTGDLIAGPVKVKPDGTYEIELPKDKVKDGQVVDVKQKEDGKPISEPVKVTLDITGVDKPLLDQPDNGDTSVTLTPPADEDAKTIIVTLPGDKTVELTKDASGKWQSNDPKYPVSEEDGKVSIGLPKGDELKENDVITAVAGDAFGNQSEKDKKTVEPDIIPVLDPNNPPKPASERVKLTFVIDSAKGSLKGTKVFLVRPGLKVDKSTAPKIVPANGYEVAKQAWDTEWPLTMNEDKVVEAQLSKVKPDDNNGGIGGSSGSSGSSKPTTPTKPSEPDKKPSLEKDLHYAYMFGYPDGRFEPNRPMTRAEVAALFTRLTVKTGDIPASAGQFSDVSNNQWYTKSVNYLAAQGIISGYKDGTFRPNKHISRAEFAAIASRFADVAPGEKSFPDVSADHWARNVINAAAAADWIRGYEDGTFRPERDISRAEVVSIVNRMLNRHADLVFIKEHLDDPDLNTFTDVMDENYWAYGEIMEATNGHDFERLADGEAERWIKLNGKRF